MDLIIEISEWCPFQRIRVIGHESYCELDEEEKSCKFGQTGEPAKECPFRKGHIILEWKND